LDAKLRGQMRAEITKLAKRLETTVIYVTHDQIEAMTMGDRIVVMKDGIIQQAASPEELYNHPANLFVAGFIGSPTMNFISGKLAEQGASLHFVAPGVDVEIPQGKAQVLKSRGYIGKEVILGVRPEDIHEEPVFLEASPNSVFSTHVDVTENLGHEMLLYLSGVGNDTTIARVDGRSNTRDGSTVKMAIDMNKVHIFDKETEANVLLQD
jgi:multiple sugar transport system ATP-binding protein